MNGVTSAYFFTAATYTVGSFYDLERMNTPINFEALSQAQKS